MRRKTESGIGSGKEVKKRGKRGEKSAIENSERGRTGTLENMDVTC
jgi:hypothetical protein